MTRNATNGQPSAYAAEKLDTMRARWTGAAGAALRAIAPQVWPSTPLPALLGVTANATSETERYCSDFCAVGLYQIPEATWTSLRTTETVRGLLDGHDAVPVPEFADHVYDQVAIGLVSLRRDLDAMASRLSPSIRPTEGSQWQLALAIMTYVVGGSEARAALSPFVAQLAAVPEPDRFGALVQLAAADGGHAIVYPVTRAWQRLACGKALADALHQPTGWYDVAASTTTETELASALYGAAPAQAGSASGAVLLAIGAAVAVWMWWPR